jgi:hypothetical protein
MRTRCCRKVNVAGGWRCIRAKACESRCTTGLWPRLRCCWLEALTWPERARFDKRSIPCPDSIFKGNSIRRCRPSKHQGTRHDYPGNEAPATCCFGHSGSGRNGVSLSLSVGRHSFVFITPANYSACLGTGIVAHIQWDFRGAASGKSIFVSAYNLGSQPAVVGSGPLRGELDTGEWVSDGTTFLLTDDQNHVLAKRTVQTTDCAKAPIWPDASSVAIKLVV